jgi:CelD/BcsL family acetyltransferase involved in cellulose biosynthesis
MALTASVCRPTDLGAWELDQWRRMQAAAGMHDPFLSPEFARCVGAAFPQARVAVIDDGTHRVGFLAFMERRFRSAGGLGGHLVNMQGFVAEAGDWTLDRVLRAVGLDRFEFARWIAAQPPPVGSYTRLDVPVIDLADGFAAYLNAACEGGGRLVKVIEQKYRSEKRRDPDLRFEFCTEDLDVLGKLFAWKSQWLRRTGRRDVFADPRARELVELTTASWTPSLRGGVSCLRSGDRVLAVFCDVLSHDALASWISAYDPDAAQRSPGSVGLLCAIEAAAERGIATVHLDAESAPYKRKLASRTISVIAGCTGRLAKTVIVARRFSHSLRAAPPSTAMEPAVRASSRLVARR